MFENACIINFFLSITLKIFRLRMYQLQNKHTLYFEVVQSIREFNYLKYFLKYTK